MSIKIFIDCRSATSGEIEMKKRILFTLLALFLTVTPALAQGTWGPHGKAYEPIQTTQGFVDYPQIIKGQQIADADLASLGVVVGEPGVPSFAQAVATLNAAGTPCRLSLPTSYSETLSSNLTVNSNISLVIPKGAVITIPNGVTLTINGPFEAELYQVFNCTGTGKVLFGLAAVKQVLPEWWYSGSGDYSAAIQAAGNSSASPSGEGINVLLSNQYTCIAGGITIPSYVHVTGLGPGKTQVTFAPTSAATLFQFTQGTGNSVIHSSLKNISFYGSGSQTKTFVNLVDVRTFELDFITVYDTSSSGSIGVLYQGRDLIKSSHLEINCDRPIVIGQNPNIVETLDASTFNVLELICNSSSGKNIEVLDQAPYITAVTFDVLHMNAGKWGFYWSDTTATYASQHLSFNHARYEQPAASGGAGFYINSHEGIYALTFDGVATDGSTGYYLRGIADVVVNECNYSCTTTVAYALDMASGVNRAVLINFFLGNGTINSTGLVNLMGITVNNDYLPFAIYSGDSSINSYLNQISTNQYQALTAAPSNPTDGLVVCANPASWDPCNKGSTYGSYLTMYKSKDYTWHFIGP